MNEGKFSKEELERYSRHLIIPEFGMEGQRKLRDAKVLVVGAGGLGAPLLQYLCAAGVGTLGIVEFDVVEESNLHRQVLFNEADAGKSKLKTTILKLSAQNRFVEFIPHEVKLNSGNAMEIIAAYDIVADGTDNFPTRYLVNDACVLLGKTNVFASIFRFDGQVSVFNMLQKDGTRGPNYRDIFPQPPPPGMVPSCAEGGVLGVLPGIVGCMQASEVIKVISGIGEPLSGKLWVFDALTNDARIFKISRDPSNPVSGTNPTLKSLIDYEEFCGMKPEPAFSKKNIREITVIELKKRMDEGKTFQLIDVREPWEYQIANLGGRLIPKGEIENQLSEIKNDCPVIIHCRTGKRSAEVIQRLESEFGFTQLENLKGGILEWATLIDTSMPKY